jgi:hypothetical protein
VHALALRPEQHQHLGWLRPVAAKPVRGAGVEFGGLTGGATAIPGVWVAGNLADPQAQVVASAAAGLAAGAAINLDLVTEGASRAASSYARSA